MRIALYQARTGIDPAANADALERAVARAADGGAAMLFTPEMSGLLDSNRKRAAPHYHQEADDPVLARVRAAAARGIWVALGSLALKEEGGDRLVAAAGEAHRLGPELRRVGAVGTRHRTPPWVEAQSSSVRRNRGNPTRSVPGDAAQAAPPPRRRHPARACRRARRARLRSRRLGRGGRIRTRSSSVEGCRAVPLSYAPAS